MTAQWTQPAPTKLYAAWYNGAWYAEGDTPDQVNHEIRKSAQAAPSRFWTKRWRGMEIRPKA